MALLALSPVGWGSEADGVVPEPTPSRTTLVGGISVDLELVLASDASTSMDAQEKQLQRDGFVMAFRSAEVHRAISRGRLRRIAVIYVEWGGPDRQRVVLPWTLIDGAAASEGFAERLAATFPARLAYGTALGDGLLFCAMLFDHNVFEGERRVIDVSGDGMSNKGLPLEPVRGKVISEGIVINGLPIVYRDPNEGLSADEATIIDPTSNEELVAYFETRVIGGPGAFVVPVRSREHYAEAIRMKLVREISSPSMLLDMHGSSARVHGPSNPTRRRP